MSGALGQEPRSVDSATPSCDEAVLAYARDRGIAEVLHFTTDRGILGIAATGAVLSRDLLSAEQYLDYIRLLNCPDRSRDAKWTGHVSLSITQINRDLLRRSLRWHPEEDTHWCVLAFDVAILGHPGVTFADSNNAYPLTKRDLGVTGLTGMFADAVKWGYYNRTDRRTSQTPRNMPTNDRAEVLYPDSVSLQWLRHIYVPDERNIDWFNSLYGVLADLPRVPVVCRPEVFA